MYELSSLSKLSPEAQPVIEKAAHVYLRHTQRWFIGLLAHGSAVKGGFIPGCSDIDLQHLLVREYGTSTRQYVYTIQQNRQLNWLWKSLRVDWRFFMQPQA